MTQKAKRYTTTYKKRVDVERDTYLPKYSPKGLGYCSGCGAVYYRQRWTLAPPDEIRRQIKVGEKVRKIDCPGCRKIRDHYPSGTVRLSEVDPAEKGEVLRLMKNEERRAREKNPLSRIMKISTQGRALEVETTNEKLAQRLGRVLCKAHGGEVAYQWSHNNKFVRVKWSKKKANEKLRAG